MCRSGSMRALPSARMRTGWPHKGPNRCSNSGTSGQGRAAVWIRQVRRPEVFMRRYTSWGLLCSCLLGFAGLASVSGAQAAPQVPGFIKTAVADPARPDEDRQRDAARKPAETLAFAGVKPGDTVIE